LTFRRWAIHAFATAFATTNCSAKITVRGCLTVLLYWTKTR